MRKLLLSGVLCLLVLAAAPVAAQDGAVDLGAVVELTVGEVLAIGVGLVSLITALVAIVRNPSNRQSVGAMDSSIANELTRQRQNTEFMQALEKMVDGMQRQHREALKDVAGAVLEAAKWIPGEADNAAAALIYEAVDGVPVADKLTELERRAASIESKLNAGL